MMIFMAIFITIVVLLLGYCKDAENMAEKERHNRQLVSPEVSILFPGDLGKCHKTSFCRIKSSFEQSNLAEIGIHTRAWKVIVLAKVVKKANLLLLRVQCLSTVAATEKFIKYNMSRFLCNIDASLISKQTHNAKHIKCLKQQERLFYGSIQWSQALETEWNSNLWKSYLYRTILHGQTVRPPNSQTV